MSTVEVGPPPAGPNLADPTSGRTEIVSDPGPDGRGETVVLTKLVHDPSEDLNPADTRIPENKEHYFKGNVTFQQDTNKVVSMETRDERPSDVNKVADPTTAEPVENDSVLDNDGRERVIDIVKQSKIKDSSKTVSDPGEYPEFPQSRPLTETTNREESSRYDQDRDAKTPFSVVVGRKPLHTAQTRSHSDYYSKTPSTSRYTYIAASLSQFGGFNNNDLRGVRNQHRQTQLQRSRRPPKLVRLATVTMSPKCLVDGGFGHIKKLFRRVDCDSLSELASVVNKSASSNTARLFRNQHDDQTWQWTKPVPRGPSLYYEEPKKPAKLITWEEANEARPPLRIDMEGPGPTQYSPRNKPLHETNAPAWSFGSKCFVEKTGGSRTSWEKTWFQNPSVWTSKVDFYNDSGWPSPTHYRQRPLLGPRQKTMVEAPSFSIGTRKEMTLGKRGSDKEPSPVDYDKDMADKLTLKTGPSFTHQVRREGTILWSGTKDRVPGPGSYTPNFSYNKPHGPNFSIRSLRREKSHVLGPFSTL